MKIFLGLILSFGLVLSLSAQDVNKTDASGKKQGLWVKEYSNGAKRYEGNFKDDVPVGTFVYYFPWGETLAKTTHVGGGVSRTVMFHRNGKVKAKGKYLNEKKDSVWTYFDEKEVKVSTATFVNDLKEGEFIAYYPDGSKAEKKNFVKGLEEGDWLVFFESSTDVRMKGAFKAGKWEGVFTYYTDKGFAQHKGQYKAGLKQGLWVEYDKEGKVKVKREFRDGIMISEDPKQVEE